MLIESAKGEARLARRRRQRAAELSDEELREDIDLLNVVNFGGGTYVLYAEMQGDEIEVDAEPYGDNFARPARLLPLEAKALVAAIDLFGDHLPQGGLQQRPQKIVERARPRSLRGGPGDRRRRRRRLRGGARGQRGDRRPAACSRSTTTRRTRTQFTKRASRALPARQRPGGLVRRVATTCRREDVRHFRLDRIKEAERLEGDASSPGPEVEEIAAIEGGWLSRRDVPAAEVARVWVSPERARWAREDAHRDRGARRRRRS